MFCRKASRPAPPSRWSVGPRQCGKVTLARTCGGRYYDLEVISDRVRLDLDWAELTAGESLVILDEAPSWPDIFPRLRHVIDDDRRRNGRFLLLGSVSPVLMRDLPAWGLPAKPATTQRHTRMLAADDRACDATHFRPSDGHLHCGNLQSALEVILTRPAG